MSEKKASKKPHQDSDKSMTGSKKVLSDNEEEKSGNPIPNESRYSK
jgi:hypothetical protein